MIPRELILALLVIAVMFALIYVGARIADRVIRWAIAQDRKEMTADELWRERT